MEDVQWWIGQAHCDCSSTRLCAAAETSQLLASAMGSFISGIQVTPPLALTLQVHDHKQLSPASCHVLQVEQMATGAARAIGSIWGGLGGLAKDFAREFVAGVEEVGKDVSQLHAVKAAKGAAGGRSLLLALLALIAFTCSGGKLAEPSA
jgi:hypothetical protein